MSEIERLKAKIDDERAAWPGVRWRCSAELRGEVVAAAGQLIDEGQAVSALARDLGLASGTLARWLGASGDGGRSRSGFRQVEVVEGGGRLRLVTPSGYVVEGLDLRQLQSLLPGLG